MNNQAFIDGQNLHLGTTEAEEPWKVNLHRFRVYLKEKYNVGTAYYFMGYYMDSQVEMYSSIQEAGFVIMFRKHHAGMASIKKGNVDTEIVFNVMRKIADKEDFDKVVLVSGDGDYFRMVQYLIDKDKFEKILAPSKERLSSLYKVFVNPRHYDFLDKKSVKSKIAYKEKRR
jgi:uncharacterized LabA/DUF88 family protein